MICKSEHFKLKAKRNLSRLKTIRYPSGLLQKNQSE